MGHVEDLWTIPNPDGRGRIKNARHGKGLRWAATWTEPGGQRRRRSFPTKDAAVAHLEQVGVEQRTGLYVSPERGRATVREVAERWYAEQLHQRASSLQTIRRRLDNTVLPTLGGHRWNQIDRAAIQAAVTEWSSQLAPATVRVAYTYLTGICHLAVDERRIPTTPCRRINLPVISDDPVVPLTVAQVQALVDAAPARLRPMFVLAAASGLRSGELRGLTWDRISRTGDGGGVVRVDRQLADAARSFEPVWGPPKTARSVRNVPIGPATMTALGKPGEGLVFRARNRGALTRSSASHAWHLAARFVEGVGVGSGWHELRHFHASLLIAGGASPVAVAHRLGHKDPTETLRTYAHLWPDDDERMRGLSDGVIAA